MHLNEGNILEMNNILKVFPGVRALDDVSFALKKGEVHALVGENGAGKSTLIKILGGVYGHDAGVIKLNGKEIAINSPQDALKKGISIVHQELNMVPYLSVAENLFLGRPMPKTRIGLIDWEKLYNESKRILADVGLEHMVKKSASSLSVAQQQLMVIAREVAAGSKVVVFDEPTACLSQTEVIELFKVIRSLHEKGTSVIYVSHRMEEIFELADRITVLRDGKLVGVVNTRDVVTKDIITMMLGKEMISKPRTESYVTGRVVLDTKNLSGNNGIKNVSFEVKAGEVVGIAGVVGSGRTELVRLICGVDKVTGGRVLINGQDITGKKVNEIIETGVALIPENRRKEGLVLNMNIKENISLVKLRNFSKGMFIQHKKESALVDRLVNSLAIRPNNPRQLVKNLSGGNQQKVVLGKWMAGDMPKLFIFDEPTQGIDVGAKEEVHQLINDFAKKEAGVILISSDMQELLNLCDRILVFVRGELIKTLAKDELNANTILEYAMKKGSHANAS